VKTKFLPKNKTRISQKSSLENDQIIRNQGFFEKRAGNKAYIEKIIYFGVLKFN